MNEIKELIKALNLVRDGDWEGAHQIVQSREDRIASRIHAHLHRVEGDDGNAGYWYRRAGEAFPNLTLEQEWQAIYDEINGS